MKLYCGCDDIASLHTRDADGVTVCLRCWHEVKVPDVDHNLKEERRKNVFRDETTWTAEYRAGIMSALALQQQRLLKNAQGLWASVSDQGFK